MSRAIATALSLLLLLTAAPPAAASEEAERAAPAHADVVPGEVVVGWRDAKRGRDAARARGLAVVAELGVPGKGGPVAVLDTGGRSVDQAIAELNADPSVDYAEPNYVFSLPEEEPMAEPAGSGKVTGSIAAVGVTDPMTGGQYSLDRMRVRDAWGVSKGGSNLVAVLDTGVQSGHPDLKGRVVRGRDFVNDDDGAGDDNGHGTWVAGIIAANANDGYGVAGVSWTDKILPVKIMNREGRGSTADLAAGILYAADRGADVINMSVGGFPYSQAVLNAVDYAWGKGAVLVGAAGNNGRLEDYYPASYDRVISVSATQVEDEFSHWSSYGPKVDVSAPGSSVLTTNCTASACPKRGWGSHTYISGTSFAAPNVAGVVALIRAKHGRYSPSQVVSRLLSTVDDLGYPGRDDRYGLGRVNAYRALGASVARPRLLAGDAFEANNSLSSADAIAKSRTTEASIYPAGDEDWFSVSIPRAGRLDVRVTGVVDTRAYPWNRSNLPVDAIVELYDRHGNLLKRVDREWESGTELAQQSFSSGTRVFVRVLNYYANGNRRPYTIRPTFVDTVAPRVTATNPAAGSTGVSPSVVPTATFSEPVKNVSATTVKLRDTVTKKVVSASVTYDASSRQVRIAPKSRLEGNRTYRLVLGAGITDTAGNALATTRSTFTTTQPRFSDIAGTTYEAEIQWLAARRIVTGCGSGRFCPTADVRRMDTAQFVDRALALPPTSLDFFDDDDGRKTEPNINRVAAAGVMDGCAADLFCPKERLRRQDLAVILAAGFDLPATSRDYFTDDEGRAYEDAVNRVAAAGLMSGCRGTLFCARGTVDREELAASLYRALQR